MTNCQLTWCSITTSAASKQLRRDPSQCYSKPVRPRVHSIPPVFTHSAKPGKGNLQLKPSVEPQEIRGGAPCSKVPGAAQQQEQLHTRQLSAAELAAIAERNTSKAQHAVAVAAATQQAPRLRDLLTESSWSSTLAGEFQQPYMSSLQQFLAAEWACQQVFPPQHLVFRALNSCPADQVRVVILGQDPYPNDGQAMGLSFSVPPGLAEPGSLQNIFKELNADLGCKVPNHGSLEKWSHQGVLLLNACMTVRARVRNSHAQQGWELFTRAALEALSSQRSGIVFLLWGKFAQSLGSAIDSRHHHVLKAAHPSPLSAQKGFLGCRHFGKTNDLLRRSGLPPIDWQIEDVAGGP